MKLIIDVSRKYDSYLKNHLEHEHPKTSGLILVRR